VRALLHAIAAVAVLVALPARAAPAEVLPDALRDPAAPVELFVAVPQQQLRAQYVPEHAFRVARTPGILAYLIEREIEKGDRRSALRRGERLDAALAGFDLGGLALASTREAFAGLSWFRLASDRVLENPAAIQTGQAGMRQAVIAYEYAVHASYTNVFVGCTLRVAGDDADPAQRWSDAGLRYRGFSYAMVEVAGLPKDKVGRQDVYAAGDAARLKADLGRAFATCAQMAVRQARFTAADLAMLRASPKVTLTTLTNQQELGWLVEGRENLMAGTYGPLGIGKTFVRDGTPGALLLSGAGHLYHLRRDSLEAPARQ
jgi:hypothetical protein